VAAGIRSPSQRSKFEPVPLRSSSAGSSRQAYPQSPHRPWDRRPCWQGGLSMGPCSDPWRKGGV